VRRGDDELISSRSLIATAQIERFEKDQALVVVPATVAAAASPVPVRLEKPQAVKPQDLKEVINTISDQHHLDPDFISSVIHAESGFNPRAVSPKGSVPVTLRIRATNPARNEYALNTSASKSAKLPI